MFKRGQIKKVLLLLGDVIWLEFAVWLSLSLRHLQFTSLDQLLIILPQFSILFVFWVITNYINQLYDLDQKPDTLSFYRTVLKTAGISFGIGVLFFYLTPLGQITPKTILLLETIFGYCLITAWRKIFFSFLVHKTSNKKVVFVGRTKEVDELQAIINQKYSNIYQIEAIMDNARSIERQIKQKDVDLVVIAPHLKENTQERKKLSQLLFQQAEIQDLYHFYEEITGRVPFSAFQESWFLDYLGHKKSNEFFTRIRRVIDLITGLILGLITIILSPIIILAIKLESSGSAIITEKRIGKDEEIFDLYKFRILGDTEDETNVEEDKFDKRNKDKITKVGKILSKTRLDELPQAWNLIKGNLTIIGPRPEKPQVVEKMKEQVPYFHLRHIVKPGLTSWAVLFQNYADTLAETKQKLQYDLYYIKNRSFLLDLSIVMKTINVILKMIGR